MSSEQALRLEGDKVKSVDLRGLNALMLLESPEEGENNLVSDSLKSAEIQPHIPFSVPLVSH